MTSEDVKKAIKNMNSYLAECHDYGDTVVFTAKVLKSIRDNYCELLRDRATIERLIKHLDEKCDRCISRDRAEATREFAEKIDEVFLRYAHLHNYAEKSRTETIESAEGEIIEMQSVWDVLSLKKYDMTEYEEMSELQKNIEIIAKERLLTELEKDFRLLKKEMVGEEK